MSDDGSFAATTGRPRYVAAVAAVVWLAAFNVALAHGDRSVVYVAPAVLFGIAAFGWLVVRLTRGGPVSAALAVPVADARCTRRLRLQTAWLSAVVALTAWRGLAFHRVVPAAALWDELAAAIAPIGERWLSPRWVGDTTNALVNPLVYVVVPLLGLCLLGARPRELGFGRGHRVVRVTFATGALPAIWVAGNASGVQPVFGALLANTLQNGPCEEFLFRGALQTRLAARMPTAWAIGLQALVFGLWHLGAAAHGDVPWALAAARTVLYQGTSGILFGIVLWRTRNLWAGSILHVLANSAAQFG